MSAKSAMIAPNRATGESAIAAWLKQTVSIFGNTLREIFDETAYDRFLDRNHTPSSPAAYAAFRREYEVAKARRPRCC